MIEIYGTLGPACADPTTLAAMLEAGMTGVRLNLSHMTLEAAKPWLSALRDAERATGKTAGLLIDLQGPELRVGSFEGTLELDEGSTVELISSASAGMTEGGPKSPVQIPVPEEVIGALQPGDEVLLDDGRLLLEVVRGTGAVAGLVGGAGGSNASCVVVRGGELRSRKSIAIPGKAVRLPALTASDRANLRLARENGVTGVMQPFVRGPEDLRDLRQALHEEGADGVRILAKIEDQSGISKLARLLDLADEIVIARGDLGNSMPLWELPRAQKEVAACCRAAGRPFMVVTQMLASMEHCAVPTRAEVSDIFNAVLDGAASVMVTGETAAGIYPVEAIRYLVNTVREAERYKKQHRNGNAVISQR